MTDHNVSIINVHELKRRQDEEPSLCLIDVRENHEWEDARIPGAIHIPKDAIKDAIGSKVTDPNQPIYLHCRSGVRSMIAASALLGQGYQKVYSIDGGIIQWELSGYPVERGESE